MYVSVLRSRPAEIAALKELTKKARYENNRAIPLLEIVQHYFSGHVPVKNPRTFTEEYGPLLSELKIPIMIDIPLYVDLTNSKINKNIKSFLQPLVNNTSKRIDMYNSLSNVNNIIPVVSYNPNFPYLNKLITVQTDALRNKFTSLAFRIFTNINSGILEEVEDCIREEELLILDIDIADYSIEDLIPLYEKLKKIRDKKKCKIILLKAAISNDFANSMIEHDTPAPISNSLVDDFRPLGFDGFGDFSGIKKDKLEKGGLGYIATLYYSKFQNRYIGFTSLKSTSVQDFANIIAPSIIKSDTYISYSEEHKDICPGCSNIIKITQEHPGSRTTWKTINIEHYVTSILEYLG